MAHEQEGDSCVPAKQHQSLVQRGLLGFAKFVRHNPRSDKFGVRKFHHVEFWCGDATNVTGRFSWGLGMPLAAKSDQSTGNNSYCSNVLKSNDLTFVFTAPYSSSVPAPNGSSNRIPLQYFDSRTAQEFFAKHGFAARAVGVEVGDAAEAYRCSVEGGAVSVQGPTDLRDTKTGETVVVAEVKLYGDVTLRFVELRGYSGPFLPNYEPASNHVANYGLVRLDHAVGNVPALLETADYVQKFTGFHEFAEFTSEDVGTVDSGLNSMVWANNDETVLLPINEPTFGTKRKSQIQTYLEHNSGPGLQHLALMSSDIFRTIQEMRARSDLGGFEFMPRPGKTYYENLEEKLRKKGGARDTAGEAERSEGDGAELALTQQQLKQCEDLGILVDRDDQGILLQIFTKPVGDRPTLFLEIIQRVGCMVTREDGTQVQLGGCGGFGKGNFSELFKSIEDFERTLDGTDVAAN